MKKSLIILGVILLVIAATATVAIFGRTKEKPMTKGVEEVSVEGVGAPEGQKPLSGIGTLKDLQSKNMDLECRIVYTRTPAEGNIEGTLFVSKGNLRGDFMVPAPEFGGKILSSMIVGGQSLYVWSKIDKNTFGFKSDIAAQKTKQIDTKEPIKLDVLVNYSCYDWVTGDGSVFVPPADVSFKDLGTVVEEGGESGLPAQAN
jgi:hypothetical protein